jgi:peptidoglycan/xylan/chitin deacetylase (PgdA/CDA1 family)
MKYMQSRVIAHIGRAFMLIILAALPLSCASRTASVVSGTTPPDDAAAEKIPSEEPKEIEPEDIFERALWNVRRNTPLVNKYLETDEKDGVTVKGKCIFNEHEFMILYDLAAAEKTGGDSFHITFHVEDSRDGASRDGELLWYPAPDKTGLLLSFDDDYSQVWRQYFDLFDQFGAKVTFFISGAAADKNLTGFCAEALSRGHCIGYHSVHHYDLTKVSRNVFDRETTEAAQSFRDMEIPVDAFAYPFGFFQSWMHEALVPVFKYVRGFGVKPRFYDADALEPYHISKSIDNYTYPDDAQFESHIGLMLLAAKFTGNSIIPFTSHDIADNAVWGIKPQRLEYVLRTAEELKIRFYTYADL